MYEVSTMIQNPNLKLRYIQYELCMRDLNTCSCHDQPCTQSCHSQCWLQSCGPRGTAWRCLSTPLSDSHVEVRPSSSGTALFISMISSTLKKKDSSSPLWLLAMRRPPIQENTSVIMTQATTLRRPPFIFMCQVLIFFFFTQARLTQ